MRGSNSKQPHRKWKSIQFFSLFLLPSQQVKNLVLWSPKHLLHAFVSPIASNETANDCVNKLIIFFKAILPQSSWKHHHSKQALPFGMNTKLFTVLFFRLRTWTYLPLLVVFTSFFFSYFCLIFVGKLFHHLWPRFSFRQSIFHPAKLSVGAFTKVF